MRRSTELLGRADLVRDVMTALDNGRSVLLYGPEGIGKTAIVGAAAIEGVVVVDPFESITRQRASDIRRALDRGVVHLGATRAATRRALGAVGRILWRFSMIRVRELPDPILIRIVTSEIVRSEIGVTLERPWVREMVALAKGRPGFAIAMARFAIAWHRGHGDVPMPALAFACTREDAAIRSLHSFPASRRFKRKGRV